MAKLNVKKSCFRPIEGTTRKEVIRDEKHKKLVQEANLEIEKHRLRQAEIYENAKTYLSD